MAKRPEYDSTYIIKSGVLEWIAFMKPQGIQRVCCLLDERQLAYYPDGLLELYVQVFGPENVCHAPIAEFSLCDKNMLAEKILPFLSETNSLNQKVVVHCSGGSGRTGHVLAAWLVHARGLTPEAALTAMHTVGEARRNPEEAVDYGRATEDELWLLLESCR